MNLLSLSFYLQMRSKAPNDLHGLSYRYYTDLFKSLHWEQLTGTPLPCQLFQPIKLSHQSGRKTVVETENSILFLVSSSALLAEEWLVGFSKPLFFSGFQRDNFPLSGLLLH